MKTLPPDIFLCTQFDGSISQTTLKTSQENGGKWKLLFSNIFDVF